LNGIGRYRSVGDGGERGRWLSLWSAQPWRYQRASDELDLSIVRPVLTICGGLQPPLHHLLGGEGDGFRPRWLPHLATLDTSRRPSRTMVDTTAWEKTITALYEARHPRTWALSQDAFTVWDAARERWKYQASGAETPSVSAALVKADMQCARIALVLAESLAPGKGGEVSGEVMGAAVAITEYVMGCWRALPEREALTLSRKDEALQRGVDQLADWLEQHGGKAKRSVLRAAKVAGARTNDELDALLGRYEAVYPGSLRKERTGARGPESLVVYAPRRGDQTSPSGGNGSPRETPDVQSFPKSPPANPSGELAGHEAGPDRRETVDSVRGFAVQSFESTVSVARGDVSEQPTITSTGPEDWAEWSA
jgi:hypothetical protein